MWYKNFSEKFIGTGEKISQMKMHYKRFEKNFRDKSEIKNIWRKFFTDEKFFKWKCYTKEFKKNLYFGKNFWWKWSIKNLEKILCGMKKFLSRKCAIKNLAKILYFGKISELMVWYKKLGRIFYTWKKIS